MGNILKYQNPSGAFPSWNWRSDAWTPNFQKSERAYYDPETDTVFAPDQSREFYQHEMFHARPDRKVLQLLKPYYDNLNDEVLNQFGADMSFVKRFNDDPGHFYSPEELGARAVSSQQMLKNAGVQYVTDDFLKNARTNENGYGDNFRDLLHMYDNENLIKIFNSMQNFKKGGILKYQNPSSPLLVQRVNQSNANFVKRLLDPNRKSIPDWETKGAKIATHKLGWAEDDHGAYVFPEVQEIDGQLIDFSRPPYAPGMAEYMAHKNNNIVRMSPEEADWFTRNYKQYYPSFKKGGPIHIKKKNRGKFTEYCGGKVTEECIARGKKSKNSLTRKRANFASVARKWKHENGGVLKAQEETLLDRYSIDFAKRLGMDKLPKLKVPIERN